MLGKKLLLRDLSFEKEVTWEWVVVWGLSFHFCFPGTQGGEPRQNGKGHTQTGSVLKASLGGSVTYGISLRIPATLVHSDELSIKSFKWEVEFIRSKEEGSVEIKEQK